VERVRAIALLAFGALGALSLAHGLYRGRRLAWWAAMLLSAALLVALRRHPGRDVGLLLMLAVLVTLRGRFRAPAPAPEPGTPVQRRAVRTMIDHMSADSLAPFATRQDKSYVFSPDGRAAIGYRVVLGTALVGGDPVGSPDQAAAAIAAFLDLCRRRGWRPAVLGATDQAAAQWRRHRLRGVVIGDEAVLDVDSFSLETRRMRNVRQAVSRTHNAGLSVDFGPPTADLERELRPVLEAWLSGRQLRGFSMNLDEMLADRTDTVIFSARTAGGEPVAFARFIRCAGGQTLTLDVAPRGPNAPNGAVERLIVEAVAYARAAGVREVSLNFAGLRRVFESDAALSRVAVGLTHITDPWIGIGQLYRFCAKFQPKWRQRSLMLPSWRSIAAVVAAAMMTELRPSTRESGRRLRSRGRRPGRPAPGPPGRVRNGWWSRPGGGGRRSRAAPDRPGGYWR
jgi:lysyl-tRNA synthetase, class II